MPAPRRAFAVVAHALAAVDAEDREAVGRYYETEFTRYPNAVRELIADFLVGQSGVPSDGALAALKRQVETRLHPETALAAPARA